eukprot:jgi/Psemu1/51976/gm1.51976_g
MARSTTSSAGQPRGRHMKEHGKPFPRLGHTEGIGSDPGAGNGVTDCQHQCNLKQT